MKRFVLLPVLILSLVSCTREECLVAPGTGESISFVLKSSSDTRAVPVERLDAFNVLATVSEGGGETKRFYSPFSNSGGIFRSSQGIYWPSSDPGYHFYASNQTIYVGNAAKGPYVSAGGCQTDVVCAYIANPGYRTVNALEFNHILARVENVSTADFAGFEDVGISLRYAYSGNYFFRDGSWTALRYKTQNLSLSGNNDLWIIPGTYTLTVSFKDASGISRTLYAQQDFSAGRINNINCRLGSSADVVTSEDVEYEPPVFTLSEVPDVSAAGGVSEAPAVSGISQRYRVVRRYADGHIRGDTDADWMDVPALDPVIRFSHSAASGFSTTHLGYSCPGLGTAVTERRRVGSIFVKVTANGVFRICEAPVFQQANSRTVRSVTLEPYRPDTSWAPVSGGSWNSCSSAGDFVIAKGLAFCEYTSGASEYVCITTDAVLEWDGSPSWIVRRQSPERGCRILENTSTAPRSAFCSWAYSGYRSPAVTLFQNGSNILPGGGGDNPGTGGHEIHY